MTPDSATCLISIARSSVASARRRVMSGTKVQARNRLQRTDDQALFSVNTNIFKYREFVQARFIRVRIDWSAQDFADEQFTDQLQIKKAGDQLAQGSRRGSRHRRPFCSGRRTVGIR